MMSMYLRTYVIEDILSHKSLLLTHASYKHIKIIAPNFVYNNTFYSCDQCQNIDSFQYIHMPRYYSSEK